MKVYVLMFGEKYEGYDSDVRVFTSRESAEKEGERGVAESSYYDFYNVKEVEVE